jgi:hypothetical protein
MSFNSDSYFLDLGFSSLFYGDFRMMNQSRRNFLATLLALPVLYFFPSFLKTPVKKEESPRFIQVNGWILKIDDLHLENPL